MVSFITRPTRVLCAGVNEPEPRIMQINVYTKSDQFINIQYILFIQVATYRYFSLFIINYSTDVYVTKIH